MLSLIHQVLFADFCDINLFFLILGDGFGIHVIAA